MLGTMYYKVAGFIINPQLFSDLSSNYAFVPLRVGIIAPGFLIPWFVSLRRRLCRVGTSEVVDQEAYCQADRLDAVGQRRIAINVNRADNDQPHSPEENN